MKKFKIGETYRVGIGGERGNIIRITDSDGGYFMYKTIAGKDNTVRHRFGQYSPFAYHLEKVEEPVEKPKRKIVITTDGKTTTAKLYDGRKTIREAKAVCSDSDTFDFNLGAGIALARLTDRPFLGVNLSQPEYNPDDVRLPKPKTLRDVVAEREPDKIDLDHDEPGGVKHCPHHYDYLRDVKRKPCYECHTCDECWSQPYIPNEEAKPEPPKPKTLRDVVAERDPDKIDPEAKGGVFDCPCDYAYLRETTGDSLTVCPRGKDGCKLSCSDCWDRPYTPKEEAKPEPENLISPELKQRLTDAIKDAYIATVSEGIIAKLREITNEKTGGNNNE